MKPSILFITTDEQHVGTISAFGAATHKTPNIDALLQVSDVYINTYSVSPVCLPARCAWMTGLYPHKSNCISNVFGSSLPLERPNLMTLLKKQGYKTSLHGKCHFIPVPYPATRADLTLEYEHFISYYKNLGIDTLNLQDDKNNSLWYYDHYSKEMEADGLLKEYREEAHINREHLGVFPFPHASDRHPDMWVGRKAAEYIDSCSDDPEFIWVSFSGPHYPVDTPVDYVDKVDMSKDSGRVFKKNEWDDLTKYHVNGYHGPGSTEGSGHAECGAQKTYNEEYWTRWRRAYFGNVVLIDEMIGKVVNAACKKWGDDLVIIYTADHGEMMGNHSLWGKNGSLYEDVLRVPLSIHRPEQNERYDYYQTVSSLELFPTILEAAGAEVPECDGLSLDTGRDYILSMCDGRIAVIKDGFKLEHNFYNKEVGIYKELYDLNTDPHEFVNQYSNPVYSDQLSMLEDILAKHEREEQMMSTIFFDDDVKPYWLNMDDIK